MMISGIITIIRITMLPSLGKMQDVGVFFTEDRPGYLWPSGP